MQYKTKQNKTTAISGFGKQPKYLGLKSRDIKENRISEKGAEYSMQLMTFQHLMNPKILEARDQ